MITFPEPEWRPLKDCEILYFKDRFVDNTPWELLVEYWGIKRAGTMPYSSRLECERTPVYPYYNRKDIKILIKMEA
uniref:Uncharacterized protein n=1 Tax=viral metagenome TaxID=1070528 RepID=A0A6H1ZEZ2_9ZZZZ